MLFCHSLLPNSVFNLLLALVLLALSGVTGTVAGAEGNSADKLVHDPNQAVAQLEVADDLQCTLFASEPMLVNPSATDVDHRGRVWVCETVNYRRYKDNRPEGDRILILEDTDGDGTCRQAYRVLSR